MPVQRGDQVDLLSQVNHPENVVLRESMTQNEHFREVFYRSPKFEEIGPKHFGPFFIGPPLKFWPFLGHFWVFSCLVPYGHLFLEQDNNILTSKKGP